MFVQLTSLSDCEVKGNLEDYTSQNEMIIWEKKRKKLTFLNIKAVRNPKDFEGGFQPLNVHFHLSILAPRFRKGLSSSMIKKFQQAGKI